MKRQLHFILTLLKMKMTHLMVFRLSFFGVFFVDGSMFALQLLMFSVIYSQVDSIGGFSYGEMILFTGTFSLLNAINMVIYFFGVISIPYKIKSGDLDHYLTKPVNPLLRLTFESVDFGSIPLIIFSILIIIYGAGIMEIMITPFKIIGYVLFIIIMVVLYYDVMLVLRTIPFFVISAISIDRLEELLVLNMKLPGVLFKGIFKVLFYFILPYGIMATVPVQFITGMLTLGGFIYAVLFVLFFTIFTFKFWRFGLRHYKSASS